MKRIIILTVVIFSALTAFPQVTITYKSNAPVPGDSIVFREIKYVSPGEAGQDHLWDFSKIQDSGKNFVSYVNPPYVRELKGAEDCNIAATEDEYIYYSNVDPHVFEIKGYTSDRISLLYSNTLIRMKYPFAYGDQFTDNFVSDAIKDSIMAIRSDGDIHVTADAYGTLVLPDRMIRNSLRVKTEKSYLEVGPCGLADRHTYQYQWYAPGYRYPVLTLTSREVIYNGQQIPVIMQNAYLCLQQGSTMNTTAGIKEHKNQIDNSDFAVVSWPNPFSETLNYSYFIRNRMPVAVGLYDITGKLIIELAENQVQADGLHTARFDAAAANLEPGVYYIRFTFDKKTVVNKVVKSDIIR